jgi:hypothetical protein
MRLELATHRFTIKRSFAFLVAVTSWLCEDLAPRARLELATLRLTAECSTIELPGSCATTLFSRGFILLHGANSCHNPSVAKQVLSSKGSCGHTLQAIVLSGVYGAVFKYPVFDSPVHSVQLGKPELIADGLPVSELPVIRPESMPCAEITSYKPTHQELRPSKLYLGEGRYAVSGDAADSALLRAQLNEMASGRWFVA